MSIFVWLLWLWAFVASLLTSQVFVAGIFVTLLRSISSLCCCPFSLLRLFFFASVGLASIHCRLSSLWLLFVFSV